MTPVGGISFIVNVTIVALAYVMRPFPRTLKSMHALAKYVFSNSHISLITSILIVGSITSVILYGAIAYVSLTLEPAHMSTLGIYLSQNADEFSLSITNEIFSRFQNLPHILTALGGQAKTLPQ